MPRKLDIEFPIRGTHIPRKKRTAEGGEIAKDGRNVVAEVVPGTKRLRRKTAREECVCGGDA